MDAIIQRLAQELERPVHQVENVVHLIDEGNTIPFIARYRKELHGSMDDQLLRQLAERLQYLRNLEARKEEVRSAIEGQGQAELQTEVCVGGRRDAGGGGGPVPALQAQAPHPGHYRPGEGVGSPGGAAVRPRWSSGGPGGGGPGL